MTIVTIYSTQGNQTGKISVHGDLEFVSGRTSRVGTTYYKGLGAYYKSHLTFDVNEPGVVGRSPVFYCGYHTVSPIYKGKFGIIQRRYQPYFSDFIGSCGVKELSILRNSKEFGLSAVEVKDFVEYDPKHHQYYFVLTYRTGRTDFLDGGNPGLLLKLLRFMTIEGWCFPWDKTSIRDITADGLVHDVADLFQSKDPINLFGSVYSVFYSLSKLTDAYGDIPTIFLTAQLLNECGVEISMNEPSDYYIRNYLLPGRNCAHVESSEIGDSVRQHYLNSYKEAA